jgi:hypothetical protein
MPAVAEPFSYTAVGNSTGIWVIAGCLIPVFVKIKVVIAFKSVIDIRRGVGFKAFFRRRIRKLTKTE